MGPKNNRAKVDPASHRKRRISVIVRPAQKSPSETPSFKSQSAEAARYHRIGEEGPASRHATFRCGSDLQADGWLRPVSRSITALGTFPVERTSSTGRYGQPTEDLGPLLIYLCRQFGDRKSKQLNSNH